MYKIKPASEVAARKQIVQVGAPDNTYPDLVFTTEFSRDIILSMNSMVLRSALLNSKEFLESILKIKVVDVSKVLVKEEEKPKVEVVKKTTKKKTVGELEWK
jgi:hypothetical protein